MFGEGGGLDSGSREDSNLNVSGQRHLFLLGTKREREKLSSLPRSWGSTTSSIRSLEVQPCTEKAGLPGVCTNQGFIQDFFPEREKC